MLFFEGKRYCLMACVVMDDHVHAVVMPNEARTRRHSFTPGNPSARIDCARWVAGAAESGMCESFDRIVRNDKEFAEKMTTLLQFRANDGPSLASYVAVVSASVQRMNRPARRRPHPTGETPVHWLQPEKDQGDEGESRG